jgi:hypothetical protein
MVSPLLRQAEDYNQNNKIPEVIFPKTWIYPTQAYFEPSDGRDLARQ